MPLFGRGKQQTTQENLIDLDGLRRIANDLTKLEINTIVKPDLTACKMPAPPLAVLEVAVAYRKWLSDHVNPSKIPTAEELEATRNGLRDAVGRGGDEAYGQTFVDTGTATFRKLAAAAKELAEIRRDSENSDEKDIRPIAHRIQESSLFLIHLIERYAADQPDQGAPPGELVAEDMVALRKIWEVGTQSIKLQTVIQLDGDVITYVQSSVAETKDDPITKIHDSNVKIAMDSWQFLVATVGKMAGSLIGILVPSSRAS